MLVFVCCLLFLPTLSLQFFTARMLVGRKKHKEKRGIAPYERQVRGLSRRMSE
jgi:hypothetical protein